jgi:hypothetical protein
MSKIGEWFKRWWLDRKEGNITITGFVDYWSIIHWAFWCVVAHVVEIFLPCPWWIHLLYGLAGGYAWEAIEYPLQRKYPERWSNRVESMPNSFISDLLFNLLGVAFGAFVVKHYHHRPFWANSFPKK